MFYFNSFSKDPENYKNLEDKLSWHCDVAREVENEIIACLDLYYTNLY